jgi:hypothetical protein
LKMQVSYECRFRNFFEGWRNPNIDFDLYREREQLNRRNERLEEGCEMRRMEDREIIYRCLFLGSLCKYSTRKK